MITLIHGFNVKDPEESTGKLKPYLKDAIMYNYGWRLFSVVWHNKEDARILKDNLNNALGVNDERIVFAHSNGAAIAVEAAKQGAKITTLICINPALKCKTKFPDSIDRIIVIHTKHDKPTKAARFFDKVPLIQLFVPNAWGAMGAKGYKGKDKRVKNWDLSSSLKGHSDFFDKDNLDYYMPQLNKLISGKFS